MKILLQDDLKAKGIPQGPVQIWRLVRAGKFPKPVKIGARNGWPEHEIDAWLAERIAVRDAEAA